MKLVFCGTPLFAVPSLERLAAAGFELQLVVTQPDRPQGAGDFHRETLDPRHPAEAGKGGNSLNLFEQGAHQFL